MAEPKSEPNHAEELDDLIQRAQELVARCEAESNRWQALAQAVTAALGGGAPTVPAGGLTAVPQPVLTVKLEKDAEPKFWKRVVRVGQLLSPIAVLIAVSGFLLATCQYNERVKEMNATIIHNLSREGRLLGRELNSGDATTGEAINFHFSAYYLQKKGVVELDLQPLLLLDFCTFIKERQDFDSYWDDLSRYYPEDFQTTVTALAALPECSLEALEEVSDSVAAMD